MSLLSYSVYVPYRVLTSRMEEQVEGADQIRGHIQLMFLLS